MSATHKVNVWLGNEEGLYREVCALAARADDEVELADSLKAWVTGLVAVNEPGMRSDLVSWALSQVDWHELADAWWHDDDDDESEPSPDPNWMNP